MSLPVYGPEIERRLANFRHLIAPLHYEHRHYLEDEGLKLEDCYTLELSDHLQKIRVASHAPFDLDDSLREAFRKAFN